MRCRGRVARRGRRRRGPGDVPGDREAEAAAPGLTGPRGIGAEEAVEDPFAQLGRDAGTLVGHHDAPGAGRDRDAPCRGGLKSTAFSIRLRIARAQPLRVGEHRRRVARVEHERDVALVGRGSAARRRPPAPSFAEIHRLRGADASPPSSAAASVSRSSTVRLIRSTSSRALSSTAAAAGGRSSGAQADVDLRAHRGQRRAQLVRRVGDEAALLEDGVLDPVEHRVERAARCATSSRVRGSGTRSPSRVGADRGAVAVMRVDRPHRSGARATSRRWPSRAGRRGSRVRAATTTRSGRPASGPSDWATTTAARRPAVDRPGHDAEGRCAGRGRASGRRCPPMTRRGRPARASAGARRGRRRSPRRARPGPAADSPRARRAARSRRSRRTRGSPRAGSRARSAPRPGAGRRRRR